MYAADLPRGYWAALSLSFRLLINIIAWGVGSPGTARFRLLVLLKKVMKRQWGSRRKTKNTNLVHYQLLNYKLILYHILIKLDMLLAAFINSLVVGLQFTYPFVYAYCSTRCFTSRIDTYKFDHC